MASNKYTFVLLAVIILLLVFLVLRREITPEYQREEINSLIAKQLANQKKGVSVQPTIGSDGQVTWQRESANKPRNPEIKIDVLQEYFSKQKDERVQLLKTINDQYARGNQYYAVLYNAIVPEMYCPDMVRIGNVNDGGKWICNPWALPRGNCSVYSLGLNNEVSFEKEVQQFTKNGCRLFGYDVNYQYNETKTAYAAMNGNVGQVEISNQTNFNTSAKSIETLFEENGDSYAEIFKIDIEGAENLALEPFLAKYRVCQILIELHGQPGEMLQILVAVAKRGYLLYFFEVNGNSLSASEFSFIHPDCAARYEAVLLAPYLAEIY
ncbi:unnamed protein product [Caenorhabditis auriculariae]|uniref:Methyltransferase domain-containing protein n=1 Tax=Caenorhabditis auriculariae TaxID=2777116 RepID=A0A8S1HM57_9PELO|nr:unnamed protein product [Caenorhabditis auriculariae]